jgi:uncharacterized protein YecE (DUF72 family)
MRCPCMVKRRGAIYIGTAGWQIRREHHVQFDGAPSALMRYATRLSGVEINSSFYRPHRPQTYIRWAADVPASFRFAIKMPRAITHELRLRDCEEAMVRFLKEASGLGNRLGPLLIQLPPKLEFDSVVADAFFSLLWRHHSGAVVCEPRHASWFTKKAGDVLRSLKIARVAADPPAAPGAEQPGGWDGLVYYRLHGSPRMYHSAYESAALLVLAANLCALAASGRDVWCIFDNTARGAATLNALEMLEHVEAGRLNRSSGLTTRSRAPS